MSVVLFASGFVFLWLALHPFTTFPLSLWLINRWGIASSPPKAALGNVAAPLTFAICTCAYNEERVIGAKLDNLVQVKDGRPDVDLLVYVDAASDRTLEICQEYANAVQVHGSEQRHGKTHGMNLLVRQTRADILVFTDANVMLAPDVVTRLAAHFADDRVGCVCGNLTYVNADASATAQSGSLYWRIEETIKRLESVSGNVIGADGSLFAMRRSLHQPPPDHLIDDFYLSLMVMCQDKRVVQATDVKAFEETVPVSTEEFRRKMRIACQAFNVHRLLWPRIAALPLLSVYKYVSHKLLRWLSIYFLSASWLCLTLGAAASGWWTLAILLTLSPVALWALGSKWPVRPFPQVYEILSAFAGTGLGVWLSLRGERFQTWSPAASLRK